MLALLKSRSFLVLVGLVLLALLVWFAGPYFAFADHKPLESMVARLVVILAMFFVWAIVLSIRQLRVREASNKLATGMAAAEPGARSGGAASSADSIQLGKRFEEAVAVLRKSRKGGGRSLYELPWYIIIGPPGSGKTTVLVNSGLNFPLAQKFGKEALRGVGGTRNCDWWFTDEAILLDTAGRFTTQDSDAAADAAGWSAFLQLLKKYRGRQPINGVLVAISASDLLTLQERERERHVVAIRERLEELNRNLRISVPVYFLVTKCDLIAGFTEFFDDLGQDARAQVWGTTFPIEVSESGRPLDGFDREFDTLLERLQQRVIPRLEQERDARRRAAILAFPQQVAQVKPFLGDLLKRVFNSSGFDSTVMLRGVYLTSGTQEGTPIDRILGSLARNFGFATSVAAAPDGRGKSYFIERLLKQVIFHESGLAGINRRVQLQKIFLKSAAYVACLAVLALLLSWVIVSYFRNASYVDSVVAATAQLKESDGSVGGTVPVELLLPYLDALRNVVTVAEVHRGDVPVTMRAGLYRGGDLGEAAHEAYLRELNRTLVPLLAQQYRQNLVANAGAPDRLYEYLKGYLMLGSAEHRDVDYLRYLNAAAVRQMFPGDAQIRDELAVHLDELVADPSRITASVIEKEVVDQARYSLRTASIPVLLYSRLKVDYVDPNDKRAIRLETELGPGADRVLKRRTGEKIGVTIVPIYTRDVFASVNRLGKLELIKDFAEDRWVFGEDLVDLRQASALAYQVMRVYEDDYIKFWSALLADYQIRTASNPAELAELLAVLGSPASPLRKLYSIIGDQTNLTRPTDPAKDPGSALADAAAKKADLLAKTLHIGDEADTDKPGARATLQFEPIRKLVEGQPGSQPIDGVLGQLRTLQAKIQTTGGGVGNTAPTDPASLQDLRNTLDNLAIGAKLLPPDLAAAVLAIASEAKGFLSGVARTSLLQSYQEAVQRPCHDLIEGHYPFAKSAAIDVPLADFGQVFGSGGTFDAFFAQQLRPLVDTTTNPWKWREGAPANSPGLLQQFQLVQHIRELYFRPGSQAPELRFTLFPNDLDANVARLAIEVDGQSFEYRHGPQVAKAMVWPGPGGVGKASVVLEDRSGVGPAKRFEGPWAWFRLLDSGQFTRVSDTRYQLAFSLEGRSADLMIEAASIRNPFGERQLLSQFHCGL